MSSNRHPVQRVIDSYAGVPCQELRPLDAPHRPGEPCGEIHLFCRGHAKATADERADRRGDPCGASALKGMLVCKKHGGGTPQAKAAAERRQQDEAATREIARLAANRARPITDPTSEYAQVLGDIREWRDAANELVAALEGPVIPTASGLDVHPLVKLAERAQDRYAGALESAMRVGLLDRSNEIEAGKLHVMRVALVSALEQAGIEPEPVLRLLAAELRAIEAEGAEVDP